VTDNEAEFAEGVGQKRNGGRICSYGPASRFRSAASVERRVLGIETRIEICRRPFNTALSCT